jgi:hypothetical protein
MQPLLSLNPVIELKGRLRFHYPHSLMKKAGRVKWIDASSHSNALCIKGELIKISGSKHNKRLWRQ